MAEVISDKQRELNRTLHASDANFGSRPDAGGLTGNLHTALTAMHTAGVCNSVLDYGTGKGSLVKRLQSELTNTISITGYDPAVSQWSDKPSTPVDIVTCLDVLEHVEAHTLDAVLRDISDLTTNFCYLVIDLQPAVKRLSDGRNAHILLAPTDWWMTRITQIFPTVAAFPIMHNAGFAQKLVVVASREARFSSFMYIFMIKLNLFKTVMAGGLHK